MCYTDELRTKLYKAHVSDNIEFEGIAMQLNLSHNGCDGCIFQIEADTGMAGDCKFSDVCMSHLRNDNCSIVFTPKIEKL